MEIAALTFALDFLKSVLTGAVGDRLKRKTSPEKAKDASYKLYTALGNLQKSSAGFVEKLDEVAQEAMGSPDGVDTQALYSQLERVSMDLSRLSDAMNQIDPQLGVHAPEMAREIQAASRSRALVITRAERELSAVGSLDTAALTAVSDQARTTLVQIEAVTEDTRKFLAQQFSFKESF
jgi:hypothetical protein